MRRENERYSRKAVRDHFKGMSFPELAMASRELGKLLVERMAKNPSKARSEIKAFDKKHPEALLRLRL
jgi:hypothetical protein